MTPTDWPPGTPVRISGRVRNARWRGRAGWVATVNETDREIGVRFSIAQDWARASAEAWFRDDEVEGRLV